MSVDFAVVPVAGRGTRLLPLTKSQPKEMLPVGRKPVVQYVVEELARCGIGRLLFVTGPGKTAIENHFDIDAELIASLRETGKEELLPGAGLRARGPPVLLHPPAPAARPGPRRALRPAGGGTSSPSSWPWATRSSACTPNRGWCKTMIECSNGSRPTRWWS